jgi:3-oxoacyl-[acyl-carrier-protein] synthase-3
MDLNAACCGFMMAYDVAQMYIQQGRYRKVLIIGSESLSNLVDWTDRGTCILFGDGSGAALVKASEEASYKSVLHSDGSKGLALTCDGRIRQEQYGNYLKMDGKAVFQFAVKKVSQVILEVLETNGCTLEEVDWFVLHQANKRIIEAVARRLDVEITKFPMNLQKYGNTSSASIPILLDELHREKKLAKGDKILIAGFGAGLSWGATLMDWAIEN